MCAVWAAHMLKNYDECNNEESILHMLIPRDGKGNNGICSMHAPKSPNSVVSANSVEVLTPEMERKDKFAR